VRSVSPPFLLVSAVLSAAASIVSWFLYFTLYWPFRGRFDADGRYFDEKTLAVYHQQSGILVVPAVACLLVALLAGISWWKRRRPRGVDEAG